MNQNSISEMLFSIVKLYWSYIIYLTKDSELFCSSENDECETENHLAPDPRQYDLTDDYIYVEHEWGSLFYKHIGKRNRSEAHTICSNEGDAVHLPIPRFEEENEFYRVHFGEESLRLDIFRDAYDGLKTADGHYFIKYIKTFEDYDHQYQYKPVNINNYDWVNFTNELHRPEILLQRTEFLPDSEILPVVGKKSVVMTYTGEWMLAEENELINSVCVYNIIPDHSCSKCRDKDFCRYTGNARDETICICQNMLNGEHCEIDSCSHCQNGGYCQIDDLTNQTHCVCPYPFHGDNCESKKNIFFINASRTIMLTSLAPHSLLFTCKEGATCASEHKGPRALA